MKRNKEKKKERGREPSYFLLSKRKPHTEYIFNLRKPLFIMFGETFKKEMYYAVKRVTSSAVDDSNLGIGSIYHNIML
jgi:hypothetical protein